MDALDRPERPALHDLDDAAVVLPGVDLRAHLRDELLLRRELAQVRASSCTVWRQRLLAVDVLAEASSPVHAGKACVWSGVLTTTASMSLPTLSNILR